MTFNCFRSYNTTAMIIFAALTIGGCTKDESVEEVKPDIFDITFFAIDAHSNRIVEFNSISDEQSTVARLNFKPTALAYDDSAGDLYATDGAVLYYINMDDGSSIVQGEFFTIEDSETVKLNSIKAMAFDSSYTLYICDDDILGATSSLATQVQIKGRDLGYSFVEGLVFDSGEDTLYANRGFSIRYVDTDDGIIGGTALSPYIRSGSEEDLLHLSILTYSREANMFYGIEGRKLIRINKTTGEGTVVRVFGYYFDVVDFVAIN